MNCARCACELTPERRVESFVACRYCRQCLPIVNWQRTADAVPKPDQATLRQWEHEYKYATMPTFNPVKDNG